MLRRGLLLTIVLTTSGCLPPAGPDVNFLYGGWAATEERKVRIRGIKSRLPNAPGAVYVDGRIELFEGGNRRVGVWNFGQTRPFIILNVVPYGEPAQFWAVIEKAPGQATAWITNDAEAFERADWRQRLTALELRRLDAEWNPEPKLTPFEARLPAEAELLN